MPEHIKSQTTIASISDRRCVLADMARQSLGADRCPTATSMNKTVCTTHCGIGIVSDPIRWRVECAGWGEESGGLGTCSHLMPWQRCVPLRTKPQALSFLLPLQWQRVNRRDNCSQGITSAPRGGATKESKQEAGTIRTASLQICRTKPRRAHQLCHSKDPTFLNLL